MSTSCFINIVLARPSKPLDGEINSHVKTFRRTLCFCDELQTLYRACCLDCLNSLRLQLMSTMQRKQLHFIVVLRRCYHTSLYVDVKSNFEFFAVLVSGICQDRYGAWPFMTTSILSFRRRDRFSKTQIVLMQVGFQASDQDAVIIYLLDVSDETRAANDISIAAKHWHAEINDVDPAATITTEEDRLIIFKELQCVDAIGVTAINHRHWIEPMCVLPFFVYGHNPMTRPKGKEKRRVRGG